MMETTFEHAPRVTLYEFVADEIEKAITDRKFLPGEKLPSEHGLALQFDVSRTIVREALKILKERKLITVKDGKGAYVLSPTVSGPTQALARYINRLDLDTSYEPLFEIRLLIEPENAFLAAQRADEQDVEVMNACLKKLSEARNDIEKWVEADLEFHTIIARTTKNPYSLVFIETLLEHMDFLVGGGFLLEGAVDASVESHANIFNLIKDRQADQAREAMRIHVLQTRERLTQALQSIREDLPVKSGSPELEN